MLENTDGLKSVVSKLRASLFTRKGSGPIEVTRFSFDVEQVDPSLDSREKVKQTLHTHRLHFDAPRPRQFFLCGTG